MFRVLLCLCVLTLSNAIRVNLTGNDWIITDNINYTAKGTIPGSVHTILLETGQIPDPYLEQNDVDLRFLVEQNWVFTKNFTLTADVVASNTVNIHLDQIDTVANITINSCMIGKVNNMFLRYVYSVPSNCLHTDNQIQIDFQSPVDYALQQATLYNGTVPPECPPDVQNGLCHVNFIRKEPCSFSWDWVSERNRIDRGVRKK